MNHLRDIQDTISQRAYHTHTQIVSNSALGLLYGHGILTIYENLLL